MTFGWIAALATAYFIGSIPSAVWLGRWLYGTDVRQSGSGNAGATNTFRVLGARAAAAVLLVDVVKGMLAIVQGQWWLPDELSDHQRQWIQLALGFVAGLGHVFPVYTQFRGGKGVATFFGVLIYLFPYAALLVAVVFVVVLWITRIVSAASLSAALLLPLAMWLTVSPPRTAPLVFSLVMLATVVFTHRQNIVRLLNGKEPQLNFAGKNRPAR
ncbi:MAG: glycerol-3-phosphate 1-O-acyltransferase PlsY [Chitinophagales bacterium]|nr:glycerol-3-phosphate 1-O-acyltransferase PlsY [Chitinophagales bacterium]MDW8392845.1 glycerol-3-phosphate 1-O-acyltransferase PlsY [Chitinophagales bacterium]